jgi:MraZ protein
VSETRFSGEATVKVDDKGRVLLPAEIRKSLDDLPKTPEGKVELVIFPGLSDQRHLEFYTRDAIAEQRRKADLLPVDAEGRSLRYIWYALPSSVEVDGNGRVLVPAKMREKLNLAGEAYVFGFGKTFQMWRKDEHEAQMQRDLAIAGGIGSRIDAAEALDAAVARLGQA